ncbi:hypothetical protein ID875_05075 [Streptomyces globisporus]|uniref:Uncharacterized protein n=1 Tax=Streptomyces globisporus TaxID=1908 RepID=A0A927BJL1_STRGL|nr:hypothetical protein [Streptomyces globisporus]
MERYAEVFGERPAGLGGRRAGRRAVAAVEDRRQPALPSGESRTAIRSTNQSCTVSPSQIASTATTRPGASAARAASEGRSSGSGGVRRTRSPSASYRAWTARSASCSPTPSGRSASQTALTAVSRRSSSTAASTSWRVRSSKKSHQRLT